MHSPLPAKAYSYTRFSTPEQAKGDSATRQAQAAQRWCDQHGVALDNELTFRDEGISAFDGLNAEKGKLGAFLKAVQCGDVPKGSWLLVESLIQVGYTICTYPMPRPTEGFPSENQMLSLRRRATSEYSCGEITYAAWT